MTAKRKTKGRTAEQRRAEMDELHATLTAQVEALRNSEAWSAYLSMLGGFHRYSVRNILLIRAQRPDATRVAGYRVWQARGRQVRKSERGIRILAPCPIKIEESDTKTGEDVEKVIMRFKAVSVFDISQTDGPDLPEVANVLEGEDEAGILAAVVEYLAGRGVPVTFEEIARTANGYTTPADDEGGQRVVIDSRLSPAQQAKTSLHEAAHIVLGHTEDMAEYAAHRGRAEIEAESVAYVVAGLLGLDSSEYSTGYVAGWMEEATVDVLQETAANVLAGVHEIVQALDSEEADAAEEPAA